MIRFQDTRFWKRYGDYDKIVLNSSMRSTVDGLLYWRLLNAFNFYKFLEIGIYQGLTTGLFIESNKNCQITAIDPKYNLNLLYQHYPEATDRLTFVNKKSKEVTLENEFDFILIDGDHSYEEAWHDISQCLSLMHKDSVLAIDDYKMPGVAQAINKLYNTKHNLVPFMRTEQTEFWHNANCDRGNFLDSMLIDPICNFVLLQNETDGFSNTVLTAKTIHMLTDHPKYFDLALKEYNI